MASTKLVSFDIFDTALIRKCGKAENIFYLLSHYLYPDDVAQRKAFLHWRSCVGVFARRKCLSENREVGIEDIYADVVEQGFTEYTTNQFIEAELNIEADNLFANRKIKETIQQYRKEGWCIAFISDMYIPSVNLREILVREGCAKESDEIFVSREQIATKVSGTMYDVVRNKLKPKQWIHYGDDDYSDIKVARKKGIKAIKVNTSFTAIETLFIHSRNAFFESTKLSILAGLSRFYRQKSCDALTTIASDFIGPSYIPYILDVLHHTKNNYLRRLYFLSRDSYVLMKGAEQMPHEGIELHYLFVSRKSLLLPYLGDFSEDSYMRVAEHHTLIGKRVSDLLYALDATTDELTNYGITLRFNKISTKSEERQFLDALFNSDFTPILHERAQEAERLVVDYFRQEGLFDGCEAGMVDVGWLGSTRLMINNILRRHGGKDVLFFYYGIRGDVFPVSQGRYLSFFSAGELSTATTGLIENYFSAAPYPTTVGYRREQGKVVPVLKDNGGFKESEVVKANVSVVEQMARDVCALGITDESLLYIWAKRSIEALSNLAVKVPLRPFVENQDFDGERFCGKLSLKETINLVCFGKHTTTFDKASLCYTYGWGLGSWLWRIHTKTGQIRRRLYLAAQKRRN